MKIALFNPRPAVNNPHLYCLLEEFSKMFVSVDMYVHTFDDYTDLKSNFKYFHFPRRFSLWTGSINGTLRILKWFFLRFSLKDRWHLSSTKYDFVVGIDSEGIYPAYKYSKKNKTPLIYVSYELTFSGEIKKTNEMLAKKDEIMASRAASLIVIQDKWRAAAQSEENGLQLSQYVYSPVSDRGSPVTKTTYLRDKFKIPASKSIVLHSGSLKADNFMEELPDSLKLWDEDMVLVIHACLNLGSENKYIRKFKSLNNPRVVFSTDQLNDDEYQAMVGSADIGLALYKPTPPSILTQKNLAVIGLSSGKFTAYVKQGLPIITVKQWTYREIFTEYKCGVEVENVSQIPLAITTIKNNYQSFSEQAKRLFAERLDFNVSWPEIRSRINTLIAQYDKQEKVLNR